MTCNGSSRANRFDSFLSTFSLDSHPPDSSSTPSPICQPFVPSFDRSLHCFLLHFIRCVSTTCPPAVYPPRPVRLTVPRRHPSTPPPQNQRPPQLTQTWQPTPPSARRSLAKTSQTTPPPNQHRTSTCGPENTAGYCPPSPSTSQNTSISKQC